MTERGDLLIATDGHPRCGWVGDNDEYRRYHDEEWGRPLHGDRALYEKLCLEAFQAGLSWITILRKRDGFRKAFEGFAIDTVADYGEEDTARLLADERIIRNRAKISAVIGNARVLHAWLEHEPGGLDALVWAHAPEPGMRPRTLADVHTITPESTALARALKGRGLRFVGPTSAYALMQSAGLVDDHLVGCWRATH